MNELTMTLLYLLAGMITVTIVDGVGSVLSRKLRFNYGYLSILSVIIYFSFAYFLYKETGDKGKVITAALLLGFYEGTVCWWLCKKLNANFGKHAEDVRSVTNNQSIIAALFLALVMSGIGIWLA